MRGGSELDGEAHGLPEWGGTSGPDEGGIAEVALEEGERRTRKRKK